MKKLKSYWFVFTFIVISYNVLSQKTPNGNPADFKVKTGLHSIGYAGLWRGRVQLTVDEFLEKAKKLGFDVLMIMAKRPHLSPMDYDKKVRSKLKKRIEDQGLTLIGLEIGRASCRETV